MSLRDSFDEYKQNMIQVSVKRFYYIKLCACDGNCLFFTFRNQIINMGSMYHIFKEANYIQLQHIQRIILLWIRYSEPTPTSSKMSYCFFKHPCAFVDFVGFFFLNNTDQLSIYFYMKQNCPMVPSDYNFDKFITLQFLIF